MFSHKLDLESLLEAVPDALVGIDQRGVIGYVNHETESLFGYDRSSLVGQPIQRLVPEDLWPFYTGQNEEYFAKPKTWSRGFDVELIGRRWDGSDFPINIGLSRNDKGNALLLIAAKGGVTTTTESLENVQRLTAILEDSDDAIVSTTLDGIITGWNPAANRIYGYSDQEIIGGSIGLLIPQERPGELDTILTRVRSGQHVDHLVASCVRKDGRVIPISLTISPILSSGGTVLGVSVISRDVTDAIQALETAQRMTAIIENSGDPIFSATLDGMITSWNPAAERMFGYLSKEIIGQNLDLLVPEDRSHEIDIIAAQIRRGQDPLPLESIRTRKDGTAISVLIRISPVRGAGGAIVGVSAIYRDITEQEQAQRERAAQRAKEIVGMAELEQHRRLMVGREAKMAELKKENAMLRALLLKVERDI